MTEIDALGFRKVRGRAQDGSGSSHDPLLNTPHRGNRKNRQAKVLNPTGGTHQEKERGPPTVSHQGPRRVDALGFLLPQRVPKLDEQRLEMPMRKPQGSSRNALYRSQSKMNGRCAYICNGTMKTAKHVRRTAPTLDATYSSRHHYQGNATLIHLTDCLHTPYISSMPTQTSEASCAPSGYSHTMVPNFAPSEGAYKIDLHPTLKSHPRLYHGAFTSSVFPHAATQQQVQPSSKDVWVTGNSTPRGPTFQPQQIAPVPPFRTVSSLSPLAPSFTAHGVAGIYPHDPQVEMVVAQLEGLGVVAEDEQEKLQAENWGS